jgi:hypothetical protein
MSDDEFDLIMEATIQVCLALQQEADDAASSERVHEIARRLDESADRLAEGPEGGVQPLLPRALPTCCAGPMGTG